MQYNPSTVREAYRCWVIAYRAGEWTERAAIRYVVVAESPLVGGIFIIYEDDDERTSATMLPRESYAPPGDVYKQITRQSNQLQGQNEQRLLNRTLRQQEAFSDNDEVLRASCKADTAFYVYVFQVVLLAKQLTTTLTFNKLRKKNILDGNVTN